MNRIINPDILNLKNLTEFSLFALCFYALTPYSKNPKQESVTHAYSNLKFLYFTNIGLYITLITVASGAYYRYKGKFSYFYNTLLPTAFTMEIMITLIFWTLYYIDPALIKTRTSLQPGYETPIIEELGEHLFPVILLFINQYNATIIYHKIQSVAIFSVFLIWYGIVSIIARGKGKYPYKFMDAIESEVDRLKILFLLISVGYLIYFIYMKIKTRNNNKQK